MTTERIAEKILAYIQANRHHKMLSLPFQLINLCHLLT